MSINFIGIVILLCAYFTFITAESLYSILKDNVTVFDGEKLLPTLLKSETLWLIKFYVNWCGHCREFSFAYKALARDIADWSWLIRIGAINCEDVSSNGDENYLTCHQAPFWVSDYPDLRVYPSNFYASNGGDVFEDSASLGEMRRNIVKLIEDNLATQSWKYTTPKPDFSPVGTEFLSENVPYLQSKTSWMYLALVFEDSDSTMGKEIILDMSSCSNIMVRRVVYDESIEKLLKEHYTISESLPFVIVSDSRSHFVLNVDYKTRHFYTYKLRQLKGVGRSRARSLVLKSDNSTRIPRFVPDEVERDQTYLADIESGLRHMILMEVSANKVISGQKLIALQKLIHLFAMVGDKFPGRTSTILFFNDLDAWVSSQTSISSKEWLTKVLKNNNKYHLPASSRNWIECFSTDNHLRGYPCSLWIIFHALSVASYEANIDKGLLPEAIQGYVLSFFGCRECRNHFKKELKKIPFQITDNDYDAILWLWKIHNEVNKRLAKASLSAQSKQPFPSSQRCPLCRDTTNVWIEKNVARFLIKLYSKENINLEYLQNVTQADVISDVKRKSREKSFHPRGLYLNTFGKKLDVASYDLKLGFVVMCLTCLITVLVFIFIYEELLFHKIKLF